MNPPDRLAELAAQYALAPPAVAQLRAVIEMLARDEHAPSAVRDPQRSADVHIADSLSALALPVVRGVRSIADIGSGAGFPGVPLAVALPGTSVTLVESTERKCEFLARMVDAAELANVQVACARVEQWRGSCELVTARALGELALICEYAAPLLTLGGSLVAWKGAVADAELLAGHRAAAELGLEPGDAVRVSPYPGSATHHLHVYEKTAETPSRFPRRVGSARKQPLGRAR